MISRCSETRNHVVTPEVTPTYIEIPYSHRWTREDSLTNSDLGGFCPTTATMLTQ